MMSNLIAHLSSDPDIENQSLEDHLNHVAKLTSQFSPLLPATGELIGLCHDLGKSSNDFQKHLLNRDNRKIDHSTAGAQYLNKTVGKGWSTSDMEKAYLFPLTMPIISHHSGLREVGMKYDSKNTPTLYGRLKKEISEYQVSTEFSEQIGKLIKTAEKELAIAYSKHYNDDLKETSLELRLKYLLSALVDADWTDTKTYLAQTEFSRFTRVEREETFLQILSYLCQKKKTDGINRFRSEILEYALEAGKLDYGLFSLTSPTGSGKTRSSMGFAATQALEYQKDHIIYVMPYTTISDQYFIEFKNEMSLGDKVVEHTSSFDPEENDEKYRDLTSTWDAPVIITSVVQFFESLAAVRTSKLRKLHNICNSVIIFDEVQSFPIPYASYLLRLLRCLIEDFKCTVLMMSATMVSFEDIDKHFKPQEILPEPQHYFEIFRHSLGNDCPRVIQLDLGQTFPIDVVNCLTKYESGICIVNRRKTAKRIYKVLIENVDPSLCYCLTKDQYPLDRQRILNEVRIKLSSNQKCYVISTSILEAGIDISAQCVLREFAGLENHLQAAGRCNRNSEFRQGFFYTFELVGELTPQYLLSKYGETKMIYYSSDNPLSLESISRYFNRLIMNSNTDEKELIKFQKNMNFPKIAEKMKIIKENIVTVIVPEIQICEELSRLRKDVPSKKDLKKISQYMISLPKSVLIKYYSLFSSFSDSFYELKTLQNYNKDIGLNLELKIE